VTAVEKRQLRAAEYRRLADNASTLAQGAALGHVREKHEVAAARWRVLAASDERPGDVALVPEAFERT